MKRSVLLGLFVTASMMASTSFAAEELCAINLKPSKIQSTDFSRDDDQGGLRQESQADHAQALRKARRLHRRDTRPFRIFRSQ